MSGPDVQMSQEVRSLKKASSIQVPRVVQLIHDFASSPETHHLVLE